MVKFRDVSVSCMNVKGQAAHRFVSRSTAAVMRCLGRWKFFRSVKLPFSWALQKKHPVL